MPRPTSKPATTMVAKPASMRGACAKPSGASRPYANGAASMPSRNAMRQPASPVFGGNRPPRMPLMPSTRPFTRMKNAEATPSKMPPDNEAHGVKLTQSTVMTHSFSQTQNCS
ncbi:hypothetical protein D9M68_997870 [compost metagenome]